MPLLWVVPFPQWILLRWHPSRPSLSEFLCMPKLHVTLTWFEVSSSVDQWKWFELTVISKRTNCEFSSLHRQQYSMLAWASRVSHPLCFSNMLTRAIYRGPRRKLVLAIDIGTTYSGIYPIGKNLFKISCSNRWPYCNHKCARLPEIKGVTRSAVFGSFTSG